MTTDNDNPAAAILASLERMAEADRRNNERVGVLLDSAAANFARATDNLNSALVAIAPGYSESLHQRVTDRIVDEVFEPRRSVRVGAEGGGGLASNIAGLKGATP